jgi:Leucine-rich repeat (LRR) protein
MENINDSIKNFFINKMEHVEQHTTPFTMEELKKKKIPELKAILKEKKLKVSGNKSELIDRILQSQPKLPIQKLPLDVVRITALNLPVRDILNLCQTNLKYQQYICNNKPFWEALLLREVNTKINIPPNADINWYKEKVKNWSSVKILVEKIKANSVEVEYIQPFRENWDYFEIVENLQELSCQNNQLTSLPLMPNLQRLYCDNNQLTSLPPMPNLKYLDCDDNQLTSLPSMPNLRELWCRNNQLTSLPSMPNLQKLYCRNNQLTSLPPMPNLQKLYCDDNQLTSLPSMPNLKELYCNNNPLRSFDLDQWKDYWNSHQDL